MRTIVIPRRIVDMVIVGPGGYGTSVSYPVCVDWPELQLTEAQVITNAAARAAGQPAPYPDLSLISIRLER